jgi:hypothetical protein
MNLRAATLRNLIGYPLCAVALQYLAGCAALISRQGTDEAELLHAGVTAAQLSERLEPPIQVVTMSPPRSALELWESDHQVSILTPSQVAVSESVFKFSGRLGKHSRAVQASFDSFMTLGLAEIYLIPKALLERVSDETLQLTVWFDQDGGALAYKWSAPPK